MNLRPLFAALCTLVLLPTSALAKGRGGFDAFLIAPSAQPLTVSASALASRDARVEASEPRLGVPTVVWSLGGATPSNLGHRATAEQAARAHLESFADLYRLTSADVGAASLTELQRLPSGQGPLIARFGQSVNGIPVFRNSLQVVMNRELGMTAITGYLAPGALVRSAARTKVASAFRLSSEQAIAQAFAGLSKTEISAGSLVPATAEDAGGYTRFELASPGRAPHGWALSEPARVRRVYFTLPDRLEPALYVELSVGRADATEAQTEAFVFSATDGALLMRNDLVANDSYAYTVWADPVTELPDDGPQGTDASPHPTGIPDGFQAPLSAPPKVITLQNFPFSQNDPWLPPQATQTTGNNVDAYADLGAPDGYQPGVDLRGVASGPGSFDYVYDLGASPGADSNQRLAAITNLFYVNNLLHDWYYDSGFDERAGNAQASNYGRGGLGGDAIKAEAQDYIGRNNANMSTPADGARPRMQMYVFDGVPELSVTAPAALAGTVDAGHAAFGAVVFDLTGDVVPSPSDNLNGCAPFAAGAFTGRIALINRGSCDFTLKAVNAQAAGAVGVILENNAANASAPGLGGANPAVTLPVLSVTLETGEAWRAAGSTVSARMRVSPDLDRDGTLDNDVVSHEWAHYLSNRLIGNGNGLINQQGRGMGEGWSDFNALLLKVRPEDVTRPGNDHWQGVYALSGYVESGGRNNGYYFGIRRVPYSTDLAKDPLTFKHIALASPLPTTVPVAFDVTGATGNEAHETGEVWATMLWECYASLLNAYPFQEAQDRMKRYLVASLKVTPVSPTLLEARDALLAVAAASDPVDSLRFLNAFAKRGAGMGAKAPDRNAYDQVGVVESFVSGNNLEVTAMTLDDARTGCDRDGILDAGEQGYLRVTVRNTGSGTLSAFNGTLAVSGPAQASLALPFGNTLSFPSLAAGASATAQIPVSMVSVPAGTDVPSATFGVTFSEPSLPASAQSASFTTVVHADVASGASSTEHFSQGEPAGWDRSGLGTPAAFTLNSSGAVAASPYLHAPDLPGLSQIALTSPWIQVGSGSFSLQAKARWSFESTYNGSPFYDGAVLQITDDGVTWYDVFEDLGINPGYVAYLDEGDSPIAGKAGWAGANAGFPAFTPVTANFGTMLAGIPIRFRFLVGSDSGVGAYGFDLDDVQVTGANGAPFGDVVRETSDGTVCHPLPIADAGAAFTANEGSLDGQGILIHNTLTLDGTASLDPEGLPLSFQWVQIAGPSVTLTGADTATPTFVPDVPWDTVYSFELTVWDANGSSAPKRAEVLVKNVDQVPVAVISAPATVAERSVATVTLDGTGSLDADGEPLGYTWTQLSGPAVTLTGANTATASFATPEVTEDTQLIFSLVVNDGLMASAAATVAVTLTNVDQMPVVDAGLDQDVASRATVKLEGAGSDADGEALTYQWTQTSGPSVTLTGADTASPMFVAPSVTTDTALGFQLQVTANGVSVTDTVSITVHAESAITVDAGSAQTVGGGVVVVLRASATSADGTVAYHWTQVDGTPVTLKDADSQVATFTAPALAAAAQPLTFQVQANAHGQLAAATVVVTVKADNAPTAVISAPTSGKAGGTLTLDGSGSTDPDGQALTYAWTQTGGTSVTLTHADQAVASMALASSLKAQTLTFQLEVTDASGLSATQTASVQITAQAKAEESSGGCNATGTSWEGGAFFALLLFGLNRKRKLQKLG